MTVCPRWCRYHVLNDHRSAEVTLPPDSPVHATAWIEASGEEPDRPHVGMEFNLPHVLEVDADGVDRFAGMLDEYATRLRWLASLMRDPDTAGAPVLLKLLARGEDDWWRELDQQHALARARAAAEPPRQWQPEGRPRLTLVRG